MTRTLGMALKGIPRGQLRASTLGTWCMGISGEVQQTVLLPFTRSVSRQWVCNHCVRPLPAEQPLLAEQVLLYSYFWHAMPVTGKAQASLPSVGKGVRQQLSSIGHFRAVAAAFDAAHYSNSSMLMLLVVCTAVTVWDLLLYPRHRAAARWLLYCHDASVLPLP
jgi:hypothetical protein